MAAEIQLLKEIDHDEADTSWKVVARRPGLALKRFTTREKS
jgi:hypothetical protein